jgi:hypothetical protein
MASNHVVIVKTDRQAAGRSSNGSAEKPCERAA